MNCVAENAPRQLSTKSRVSASSARISERTSPLRRSPLPPRLRRTSRITARGLVAATRSRIRSPNRVSDWSLTSATMLSCTYSARAPGGSTMRW
jgi:hypothetical protein